MQPFILPKNSLYAIDATPRCFGLYLSSRDAEFIVKDNEYRVPKFFDVNKDWIEDYEFLDELQTNWGTRLDGSCNIKMDLTWRFLFNFNDLILSERA